MCSSLELVEIVEKARMLMRTGVNFHTEHAARATSRVIICHACNNEGHISRNCPSKDLSKPCFKCGQTGYFARMCSAETSNRFCFVCGNTDHMANVCPNRKSHPTPKNL